MHTSPFLQRIIVCPRCRGELLREGEILHCRACDNDWPQPSSDWIDLFTAEHISDLEEWERRQSEMEQWYDRLAADAAWASACFESDFAPFSHILAAYRGTILDLGGGNGITRHYLHDAVQYVVLDPITTWLRPVWNSIATTYPCLKDPPPFVKGTGEHLPFADGTFDAVLAIYTLNHVSDPERVIGEVSRVLSPGGHLFLVLEDMEPSWRDLAKPFLRAESRRKHVQVAQAKAMAALRIKAWPLQDDHIRIRETALHRWTAANFHLQRRAWKKKYLSLEYQKTGS